MLKWFDSNLLETVGSHLKTENQVQLFRKETVANKMFRIAKEDGWRPQPHQSETQ